MRRRIVQLATFAIVLAQAARADLTIRYKVGYKISDALPPAMADSLKQQMGSAVPSQSSTRIKGDKRVDVHGEVTSLVDFATRQITLLHAPTKRYSTIAASDFSSQIRKLMPAEAAAALRDIKVDVQTQKLGKSTIINGISGEEILIGVSIELPNPAGPSMQIRLEIHNWIAAADALSRIPEFKEWDAKKWSSLGAFDPAEMMTSAFAQGPAAEKLRAAMQEIAATSSGFSLKNETRIFMPMIARLLKQQGLTSDDGPVVETVTEFDSFNADPIADSVFQIPADYKPAPFEDLMREANPSKPQVPAK